MIKGQLALAAIAQAYDLALVPEYQVKQKVAVRPRGGLWMTIQRL